MNAGERLLRDAAAATPTPRRSAAAAALQLHGLPQRTDENWRYANLLILDEVASFVPAPAMAPAATPAALLPAALPGYSRLVLIDGRVCDELSVPDRGLRERLEIVAAPPPSAATTNFETAGDGRFGQFSTLLAPQPLTLRITGTQALEIVALATGAGASYLDLELQLAPQAQLDLVERQLGSAGAGGLIATQLRLRLAAGAQLRHCRLLQAAADALCLDTLSATLEERADYRLRQVSAGGGNTRSSAQIELAGADAQLQIRALAAAHATQVCDQYYTVLHTAPGTRSDQLFRGVAGDRARVACTADVQVTPAAPGSRVRQSLRGLIDGGGAEVDLRPRLTINTDEIEASHGATTGRLDDDLLFYLLSRGLAAAEARALLKWAFLGEALSGLEPATLRRAAEQATAARLVDAPAAELLQ